MRVMPSAINSSITRCDVTLVVENTQSNNKDWSCRAEKMKPQTDPNGAIVAALSTKLIAEGAKPNKTAVIKRSIVLNGDKTSVSLENEFWQACTRLPNKKAPA